jgi:heterodisulfide reductase subunit A
LVEKGDRLGGTALAIHGTIERDDVQAFLSRMIERVKAHRLITVRLSASVKKVDGNVGGFTSAIFANGQTSEIRHGVVVVATGATEMKPQSYGYGKSSRVLTQLELSDRLGQGKMDLPPGATVAMIQCVEQRNEERPFCSRVCCATAVKNALLLKERYPESRIVVLYRDMRTYGFREAAYREAREKGILFVRYEPERPPALEMDGKLKLSVHEPSLGRDLDIEPTSRFWRCRDDATRGRKELPSCSECR